jgi:hypothetical protein
MPTGRFVGDAVLHDHTDRQGHDPMSVESFRRRQIRDIGVEVLAALGAMMLRIGEQNVAWPPRDKVADIVQSARKSLVAIAALVAARTWTMLEITTLLDDFRFRKIFWPRDPFGGIRPVLAGTRHGTALLGMAFQAKKLPNVSRRVMANSR